MGRWQYFLAFLVLCGWLQGAEAAEPSPAELLALIKAQQQEIENLKLEMRQNAARLEDARKRLVSRIESNSEQLASANTMIEATADVVDTVLATDASDTHLGGYGELHYNELDNGDQIDFHRYVLFVSHQFSEDISFYSELEVEHSLAGEGKAGEVELEQAFIQWDYTDTQRVKAGLFLVPLGMINETHEPDTFYGVERNTIENNIIPATWWEAGVALEGEIAPGLNYDLAFHSGLNLDTGNASASKRSSIRSGRQKVSKANADSFAYTGRIRYSGVPGLRLALGFQHQNDLTQNDDDGIGIGEISANLLEADLVYEQGMFGLRALYARWSIDDDIELLNPGADEQAGWYIEPSLQLGRQFGIFARFSSYDLTAGSSLASNEKSQLDLGFNYWLRDNVVIKVDYQRQDNDRGTEVDGFNLGLGYSF